MPQGADRSAVALRAMAGQVGKGVVLSIHVYVSIYRRSAIQPWALRRFFEMGSILRIKNALGDNLKQNLTLVI